MRTDRSFGPTPGLACFSWGGRWARRAVAVTLFAGASAVAWGAWAQSAPERGPAPKPRPESAYAPVAGGSPKPRPATPAAAPAAGTERRSVAASLAAAAVAPTSTPTLAPVPTEPPEEPLPSKPRSGSVGYVLRSADDGRLLEIRDATGLFLPASLAKTPTALYALDALGAAYQYETRVYGSGPIVDGVLQGDLTLVGSGDPTLDTGDLADLVKQLKEAGLERVEGRFLYDAGALPTEPQIEPGQPVHAAYNPSISGLNLNFNRVLMRWERLKSGGYSVNLFAHARRWSSPAGSIGGGLLPADEGRVFRHQRESDGDESWQVSRRVLGRKGSRWLPVQIPGRYAATAFRTVAEELAVSLPEPTPGAAPAASVVLARSSSEPLIEIVRDMLRFSTNLTAEAVGLAATKARGHAPLGLQSSAAQMSLWVTQQFRLPRGSMRFANHSGLTSISRASPEAFTQLLVMAAAADPDLVELMPKHRVAGLTKATVRAKTGTMYYGRGLSGFLICSSGDSYAFSYMHSDAAKRNALDAAMDPESTYVPADARVWLGRARRIERGLLQRWSKRYCG